MKINCKCIYCKNSVFNLDYHIYTNHKDIIKDYLKNNHHILLKKCNECGDEIVPVYNKKKKKFKYDIKYGNEQIVCKKCLGLFNGVKFFREKLIKCYGFSNEEAENIYKNINENKKLNLDVFIRKYGSIIGKEKYDNYKKSVSNRYSISWWKEKYPEKWEIKRNYWIEKANGSLKNFINRFGEDDGKKRYDIFRSRCSIKNKDYRIQKFGEKIYKNQLDRYKKRKNVVSFGYFLEKYKWDYDKAKSEYKKRQQTISLEKFIEKYGEEAGKKRYESILNKTVFCFTSKIYSNPQKILSDEIRKKCNSDKIIIYDYNNPYLFYTTKELRADINQKVIIPDIFIKPINLVIEFYGDYWHANPSKYKEYDILLGKFASDIWNRDYKKMQFLKDYYKSEVLIVWENDFMLNGPEIIENIERKIYERISEIAE